MFGLPIKSVVAGSAFAAVFLVLSLLSSVALSGSHGGGIIGERQKAMKTIGGSMKTLVQMVKGEKAFDDFAAIEALEAMMTASDGFETRFPDGTQTGGETTASPKIWQNAAGFSAANAKFRADVKSVIDAGIADKGTLGAALGKVGGNCKACHQGYRVKN